MQKRSTQYQNSDGGIPLHTALCAADGQASHQCRNALQHSPRLITLVKVLMHKLQLTACIQLASDWRILLQVCRIERLCDEWNYQLSASTRKPCKMLRAHTYLHSLGRDGGQQSIKLCLVRKGVSGASHKQDRLLQPLQRHISKLVLHTQGQGQADRVCMSIMATSFQQQRWLLLSANDDQC